MPPWLLLPFALFCCTLVVPLFVLGASAGNWRAALRAWLQYATVLMTLASPGVVVWLGYLMWPPRP